MARNGIHPALENAGHFANNLHFFAGRPHPKDERQAISEAFGRN